MHIMGANLDFDGLTLGADHRGVQGAVVIVLGVCDVVVELARQVRPEIVHRAKGCVAILDVIDEDSYGTNVE